MKSAKHLLNLYLIIGLSSCAHAKVSSRPVRPVTAVCIGGDVGAECYDYRANPKSYSIPSLKNYVCIPPSDNQMQEEWIKILKGSGDL